MNWKNEIYLETELIQKVRFSSLWFYMCTNWQSASFKQMRSVKRYIVNFLLPRQQNVNVLPKCLPEDKELYNVVNWAQSESRTIEWWGQTQRNNVSVEEETLFVLFSVLLILLQIIFFLLWEQILRISKQEHNFEASSWRKTFYHCLSIRNRLTGCGPGQTHKFLLKVCLLRQVNALVMARSDSTIF